MNSKSSFHSALERAIQHSFAHLENLDRNPVAASADLQTLRRHLAKPLNEKSIHSTQVIDELVADVSGGLIGNAGGRFFGWVMGGSVPAALAADWLTSAWDQNAALYACAPAAAVAEEVSGAWLKDLLGLPSTASFALVTGCQMAHLTALAAARHSILAKHGWDVEANGLSGSPAIRVISSGERHGSIERSLRLLGIGKNAVIDLPADEKGCLSPHSLSQTFQKLPPMPTILLLQAGDLNIGAFDPFAELIPLAHQHGAWAHVDGAFGLWAGASKKYRHLLRGVELADSWATDGHKWLNVPYDCGYVFVADSKAHRDSMSHRASYLTHDEDARDQMDWNPEWSRRARGFASYAAIRELGREGVSELIERTCKHAHSLVTRIGALEGAEMVWGPTVNQGLVRFLNPAKHSSETDHNQRTDQVIAAILKTGEAFFGGTTWRGKRCMRVSVCNWQTNESDIDRAVEAARKAIKTLS